MNLSYGSTVLKYFFLDRGGEIDENNDRWWFWNIASFWGSHFTRVTLDSAKRIKQNLKLFNFSTNVPENNSSSSPSAYWPTKKLSLKNQSSSWSYFVGFRRFYIRKFLSFYIDQVLSNSSRQICVNTSE